MKRAGIIFLIFLIFYNISFAICFNTIMYSDDEQSNQKIPVHNSDILSIDISNDSLLQPFLMDSEFRNINAHNSCFDHLLNLNYGFKFFELINTSARLFGEIREVISESILCSCKYFISGYRMINLLENLFSFRT
jgi:hypothetical protein